jgi:EAL and modified HD-GYP domain-containing signal transduction protein
MVVELLETVEPDEEVIAVCRKLKELGYLLALDDFVFDQTMRPLIDLADIIKVDFLSTDRDQRAALIAQINPRRVRFLAEKVETDEEAENARHLGYSLFQGYFYSRPKIIQGRDVPGYKLNYLQLLREAMQQDLSLDKMEQIVSRDVSLAYKLLRFINSAAFSFRSRVQSIHHALVLMGVREIRKWVSLVALTGLGKDKSEELVVGSLIRARFCELVASRVGLGHRSSDLFLMGMFSMIDAFLDRPMQEALATLPLDDDIKIALLGGKNRCRDVYELTLAYERGDWEGLSQHTTVLNLVEEEVPQLYLQSVELAHKVYHSHQ